MSGKGGWVLRRHNSEHKRHEYFAGRHWVRFQLDDAVRVFGSRAAAERDAQGDAHDDGTAGRPHHAWDIVRVERGDDLRVQPVYDPPLFVVRRQTGEYVGFPDDTDDIEKAERFTARELLRAALTQVEDVVAVKVAVAPGKLRVVEDDR